MGQTDSMCLIFGVVYSDFLKALPNMSHEVDESSGNFYISPDRVEEFFQKFPKASLQYKGHTLYNACQVENICSLKSDGNFAVNPRLEVRVSPKVPGWPDAFAELG